MPSTADKVPALRQVRRIFSERRELVLSEAARLQTAIDCIDQEIEQTTHLSTSPTTSNSTEFVRTRMDAFLGMPLATAVRECLQTRQEPLIASEILELLKKGGFAVNSLGPNEDVQLAKLATVLRKNSRAFRHLRNGAFGLVAWYPEAPNSKEQSNQNHAKLDKSTAELVKYASGGDSPMS